MENWFSKSQRYMIKKIQSKDVVRDFGYIKGISLNRTWHQAVNNQEQCAYPENRKLSDYVCACSHTHTQRHIQGK